MITDPNINAWFDQFGNENADLCAWTFGQTYSVNGSRANVKIGDRDYLLQQNLLYSPSGSVCAQDLKFYSRKWETRLSTGSVFTYTSEWATTTTPKVSVVGIADVYGNGTDDLILQYDIGNKRYWEARLSTGSSFQDCCGPTTGQWATTTTPNVSVVGIADVNGDHRADLILQYDQK